MEPLGLTEIETLLLPPADRQEFEKFQIPKKPQYALVSSIDSMILLRRDLQSLLAPEDAKPKELSGGLTGLPSHAILDRGRLVGLWEYDTETESIAWRSFGVKDRALQEQVERTETYIRKDLGDARSFSLDSPKSRAPRIAALRKAAK